MSIKFNLNRPQPNKILLDVNEIEFKFDHSN